MLLALFLGCAPRFQRGPIEREGELKLSGSFLLRTEETYYEGTLAAIRDSVQTSVHLYSNFGVRYLSVIAQNDSVTLDMRGHEPVRFHGESRAVLGDFLTFDLSYTEVVLLLTGYIPPRFEDSAQLPDGVRAYSRERFGQRIEGYDFMYEGMKIALSDPDAYHFTEIYVGVDSSNYITISYN